MSIQQVRLCALLLVMVWARECAGGNNHNQGSIEKLLAAGLIAKALAKGGEEGGGGHHHFMPVHVPMHSHSHGRDAGGHHHHHVHHKYVPIPVKHHTNFIIAHHKVPVPVVQTKVVHVPVEKTKIVPIIVHKGQHTHPHHAAASTLHPLKKKKQIHLALPSDQSRVRITSLGTLRQSANGTALKFQRRPDKWIVVVKSKKRRLRRTEGKPLQ